MRYAVERDRGHGAYVVDTHAKRPDQREVVWGEYAQCMRVAADMNAQEQTQHGSGGYSHITVQQVPISVRHQ